MAISKIKKIEIIGLEADKEKILFLLQKLGIVELIAIKDISKSLSQQTIGSDANLFEIEETLSYLAGFQEKSGFLQGLVKLKPLVYPQESEEVIANFDYLGLLKDLLSLRNHLTNLTHHKERLTQERQLLSPWRNLSIPLEQIHYTQNCGILLGILRSDDYEKLLEDYKKEDINLSCECLSQDKTSTYLVMLYLKEEFGRLEAILKNHRFYFVTLSRHKGTAEDRLLEINREVLVLDDQIQKAKEKIAEMSEQRFKLMVVYDYLANIKRRQDAEGNLEKQQFTFRLSGWIRTKDINLLEKLISPEVKDTAIFISEPRPDEDVPIALENKPIIQPFEAVTNLYGQPLYNGLDPSGFLAPFFALSFAFCMMDAGWGIVLLLTTAFYLKKKQISIYGKNLLRLFLFMSIATIFVGLITGNFFADSLSRLPPQFAFIKNIQRRLVLFDPIKDSLLFLGVAIALGYIQIWTGVVIKFVRDFRKDRFKALILDLPTLLIQTSLLILALVFSKLLPVSMVRVASVTLILSCIVIIYYQWKSNPDIGQKIFWSIFGIYAIVTGNFLADTLSFSRIFALGITGGLLGMAINEILLPKGPVTSVAALLGAVIAIIIWLITQTIIMAINILGAYVQTSRLQYLEFFTKFFESGGRPFRPFKEETKYIFLAEK